MGLGRFCTHLAALGPYCQPRANTPRCGSRARLVRVGITLRQLMRRKIDIGRCHIELFLTECVTYPEKNIGR